MSAPGIKWAMALSFAWLMASGCAKGDTFEGNANSGGNGGSSGGASGTANGGMGGSSTSGSMGGMSSSGGNGGTTSSNTTTTSDAATTTGSGMTTTSTTTGGGNCPMGLHECNGMCVGNTAATGCLQSVSCTPCPVPANGSAICTADGLCDVSCQVGYMKQGSTCVCATQCCTVADCAPGETCANGVCSGGSSSSSVSSSVSSGVGGGVGGLPCTMDDDCPPLCIVYCASMMKLGLGGTCAGGMCSCQCL